MGATHITTPAGHAVPVQGNGHAAQLPVPGQAAQLATRETSATAVAAQARATVEARFLVAMNRPRNWDEARVKLLAACRRPGFAETALYQKPVGAQKVTGPSIRFVEEALRCTQNVLAEATVVYDDDEKRIVRVTVTDLEANISYPQDVVIAKTVERRSPKQGQTIIRSRQNAQGQLVYIVEATEDDLLVKQNALTSKAVRTGGLRLIPGDIVEEAIEAVQETLQNRDAQDPAAAKKKLVDVFYNQGVGPRDLEDYLGHPLEQTSPAEIGQLRLVFQAIRDGETTWAAVMEERSGTRANANASSGEPASESASKSGAAGLRSALNKKKEPVVDAAEEGAD